MKSALGLLNPWRTNQEYLLKYPKENLIGIISVFLIYAGVYFRDLTSTWFGPKLSLTMLAIGLIISLNEIIFRLAKGKKIFFKKTTLAILLCWITSMLVSQSINASPYYIAPLLAFLIINLGPRTIIFLFSFHLLANLLVQFYEYYSGSYFFLYETVDGTELDEKLFGGLAEVFRAKGFFQGPLSAVAFASWLAFIHRRSIFFAILMFISAFLAGGRLGMLIAFLLTIYRYSSINKYEYITKNKRYSSLFFAIIICITTFQLIDPGRIAFISNALELNNAQNLGRFYYWLNSIIYYINYTILELIFGKFGFIKQIQGGTENDFLRILLDHGVVGFIVYFSALMSILKSATARKNRELVILIGLIFTMMNVFPFIQSLNSNIIFWLFIFLNTPTSNKANAKINNLMKNNLTYKNQSN